MGKYAFEVDMNANKIEIAEAVQKIFTVDVVKVNTLRVKGKTKRMGRYPEGKTPDWKKAYVTLKPGQRIEIFEGSVERQEDSCAVKQFKPTSPARRYYTVSTFEEITKIEPEKSLLEPAEEDRRTEQHRAG